MPTWVVQQTGGTMIGPATRRAYERHGPFHGFTRAIAAGRCKHLLDSFALAPAQHRWEKDPPCVPAGLALNQKPGCGFGSERPRTDTQQSLQFAVVGHQVGVQPMQGTSQPRHAVAAQPQQP